MKWKILGSVGLTKAFKGSRSRFCTIYLCECNTCKEKFKISALSTYVLEKVPCKFCKSKITPTYKNPISPYLREKHRLIRFILQKIERQDGHWVVKDNTKSISVKLPGKKTVCTTFRAILWKFLKGQKQGWEGPKVILKSTCGNFNCIWPFHQKALIQEKAGMGSWNLQPLI